MVLAMRCSECVQKSKVVLAGLVVLLVVFGGASDAHAFDDFMIQSDPDNPGSSSADSTLESRFMPLTGSGGYANLHHNVGPGQINWPLRSENCPSSSDTIYKTMPWQPQSPVDWLQAWYPGDREEVREIYNDRTDPNVPPTPPDSRDPLIDGDYFHLSGDCQSSPTDGGTQTTSDVVADTDNGGRGAWLNWNALGGWTGVPGDSPVGFSSGAYETRSTNLDTSQFDGTIYQSWPRMWATNSRDTSEHSSNLFNMNNHGPWSPPGSWRLTSSGVSVFRHSFEVSQEDIDRLRESSDANLRFRGIADDWMQVFINGRHIGATTDAVNTVGLNESDVTSYLREGTNVLAIQAIDKAAWHQGGGSGGGPNAAALAYRMEVEGTLADPFEIETDIPTNGRNVRPGETIDVRTYAENVGGVESDRVELTLRVNSGAGAVDPPTERTWLLDRIPPGRRRNRTQEFTVNKDAQRGDEFCFISLASPRTSNGGTARSTNRPCFTVVDFEIETDMTGPHQLVKPGDNIQVDTRARNVGNAHTNPETITLGVDSNNGDIIVGSSSDSTNVGTIPAGGARNHTFDFRIDGGADDGERVCFDSWAEPRNSSGGRANSPGNQCFHVVRNFEMEGEITTPGEGDQRDELMGNFDVSSQIENVRSDDNDDSMSTQGHEIKVTLSVDDPEHRNRIDPLEGSNSSSKSQAYNQLDDYTVRWTYNGNGGSSNWFGASGLNAQDAVRATTRISEGADQGEVCFNLVVETKYRDDKGEPGGFPEWGGHEGIDTNDTHTDEVCIVAIPVDGPYATTSDGDVHGGSVRVAPETTGDDCTVDDIPGDSGGDVRGQVEGDSGSKSTYAVSATGLIRNFGSQDNTGSNVLQFGNQTPAGSYRAVCRPDLTDQSYYDSLGYDVNVFGGNHTALENQINNGSNNKVIVWNRSDPEIGGLDVDSGRRATIITPNDVDITGYINVNNEGTWSGTEDIPALALVAAGDININSNVENIDAYISSNGTVDTCGDIDNIRNPGQAEECDQPLTIRGALLAQEIQFRRTGRDDGSGYGNVGETGPAETIAFAPEYYLSPPPGIMGITNNIFFESPLRERLPFF